MVNHPTVGMKLLVFSPRRYLSAANGAELDQSQTHTLVDFQLPTISTLEIQGDSDQNIRAAIDSLISYSAMREDFLTAIESGAIPKPIVPPLPAIRSPQIVRYSPDHLQSQALPLVELFNLTDLLVDLAELSEQTKCLEGGEALRIFHSPQALIDTIESEWLHESIQIDLRGDAAIISAWGESHGFSSQELSDRTRSIRIDATYCDRGRLQALQSILATTRKLHPIWFEVTNTARCATYAWHGRCQSCSFQGEPFKRSRALEALQRSQPSAAPHELARIIGDSSLSEALRRPISQIFVSQPLSSFEIALRSDATVKDKIDNLKAAIQVTVLGSTTLLHTTAQISPHLLSKVILVALAIQQTTDGSLSIIESPFDLSAREQEVLKIINRHGPAIWVRDNNAAAKAHAPLNIPTAYPDVRAETPDAATPDTARQVNTHYIPLFGAITSDTQLVAHELGILEPLTKLFAASHQAKVLGISAKDLQIGQLRRSASVCATCKGSAFISFDRVSEFGGCTDARPCTTCWGTRFTSPAREISFKGVRLWEILNAPIKDHLATIRALPKMRLVMELVELLDLSEINLGLPTKLLSRAHQRLLSLVKAILRSTPNQPTIIELEEPELGFTETQILGLRQVLQSSEIIIMTREKTRFMGRTSDYASSVLVITHSKTPRS